jgi:general secretion pathway protein G
MKATQRTMRHWRARTSGFTLLEIMTVVVIIGMLATLVITATRGQTRGARDQTTKTMIGATLRTALNLYELDNGNYPTSEQGLKALIEKPGSEPAPQNWKRYLDKQSVPKDPWGSDYIYVCPGQQTPDGYDLSSPGEDRQPGTPDDICSWKL